MDKARLALFKLRFDLLCRRMCDVFGHRADNLTIENWWNDINRQYQENHRHHHVWSHIWESLEEFDRIFHLVQWPMEMETGIWFHDYFYDISCKTGKTNEEKSADAGEKFSRDFGMDFPFCQRVVKRIKATDHGHDLIMASNDDLLIRSIDLIILGQDRHKYMDYAFNIRQEYQQVPLELYREKRAEFLEALLDRDKIFPHDIHAALENPARANIAYEIELLRTKEFPKA